MPNDRSTIKTIDGALGLGFSLTEAIQRATGESLQDFADRIGFRRPEVSMCLLGYHQRTYPEIRDAICEELGISREFLDEKIEEQAARTAAAAESA